MKSMTTLTKTDLLALVKLGDSDAENELLGRYERMHLMFANEFSRADAPAGIFDDLLQAAREGTLHAIRDYDPARGAQLTTFVYHCAHGYVQNAWKRMKRGMDVNEDSHAASWNDDLDESSEELDENTPERQYIEADLAKAVYDLISAAKDIDLVDREVVSRRLLAHREDSESLAQVGAAVGLAKETVRFREKKLMEKTLPRALRGLRDAV
jgi:RNA polymerase sigma factor (sigma-70 family)